jgi:hypothetical protein
MTVVMIMIRTCISCDFSKRHKGVCGEIVKLYALISTSDVGEWSVLHFGYFYLRGNNPQYQLEAE